MFSSSSYIESIRNIGLVAVKDSEKAAFAKQLLLHSGKNASDEPVATAVNIAWKNKSINLVNIPHNNESTDEGKQALRAFDGVVSIASGDSKVIEEIARLNMQLSRYLPKIMFVDDADFEGLFNLMSFLEYQGVICPPLQYPIDSEGLVDLVKMKALYFDGNNGETIREEELSEDLKEQADEIKTRILSAIDFKLAHRHMNGESIDESTLKKHIRTQVIAGKLCPIFMGSTRKNKGLQLVLDAIQDYLPNPSDREYPAYKVKNGRREKAYLVTDDSKPLVGSVFRLEDNKAGQLAYMRVYQGKIKKGDSIYIHRLKETATVSGMVKVHAGQIEEVSEVAAGDILALSDVKFSLKNNVAEGDIITQADERAEIILSSKSNPPQILSVSIKLKDKRDQGSFAQTLEKITKHDPDFNAESSELGEHFISGAGYFELVGYLDEINRSISSGLEVGELNVIYREAILEDVKASQGEFVKEFEGKKQYAYVVGDLYPLSLETIEGNLESEFINDVRDSVIPDEYIPATEKGFNEFLKSGPLTGSQVVNLGYRLYSGLKREESSSLAFKLATIISLREGFKKAKSILLEPVVILSIKCPTKNTSEVKDGISKRKGKLIKTEEKDDITSLEVDIPLSKTLDYTSELRSLTSDQGYFYSNFKRFDPVPSEEVESIVRSLKID